MDPERRALQAQTLLNDDLLKESFALVEADCLERWKSTTALSVRRREQLWHELKAIERVKAKLQAAVSDGQLFKANRK